MKHSPSSPRICFLQERYVPALHDAVINDGARRGWKMRFCSRRNGILPDPDETDGLLLLIGTDECRQWVVENPRPSVRILCEDAGRAMPSVLFDQAEQGRQGALHLLDQGFRNCAFLRVWDGPVSLIMRDGFENAIRAAGGQVHRFDLTTQAPPADYNTLSREIREKYIAQILATLPMPLGVMVSADVFATDVLHAARGCGFAAPQRLAVIAPENYSSDLAYAPIGVTALDSDLQSVARHACELLARQLAGEILDPGISISVPPRRVVMRESTSTFISSSAAFAEAVLHLRRHFRGKIYVDELAKRAGMSERRFQEEFRQSLGRTVRDELMRLRLDLAQHLMRDSGLTVAAIALESGFGDKANLYRALARHRPPSLPDGVVKDEAVRESDNDD
ncbi:MAG: Xylose operon regulatory protein [Verrucomicrobiota bacterium]|jgi:LacI family transcriptional regulator